MNLKEACMVFGINNIKCEDKKSIKRRYRELMVMYHPDNCGDNDKAAIVGEAYSVLNEIQDFATAMRNVNNIEINIVDLRDIIDISDINKIKEMAKEDTFVLIDTAYCINGTWFEHRNIVRYNVYGRYNIEIRMNIDYSEQNEIDIRVCNKLVSTTISTQIKNLVVRIGDNVELYYKIISG